MIRTVAPLAAFTLLAAWPTRVLAQGPAYADAEARTLIAGMLEAHGGMEPWLRARGFRYTATMHLTVLPPVEGRTWGDSWRVYTVTLDPRTSRGYVELPMEEGSEPSAGWNGTTLWRRPYRFDPPFQDDAFQLLYFHYSMLVLPWLTQVDGTVLRTVTPDSLPGYPALHDVVEMTFQPRGAVHEGKYLLYLDRDTHRLRGWTQTTMVPRLPGTVIPDSLPSGFRPSTRVVDSWVSVGGLLIPETYVTVRRLPDGTPQLNAVHLVRDPAVVEPNAARWAPPSDAMVRFRRDP